MVTSIKLPRIPDRSPVKLAIDVPPELARALDDYAAFYARNYASTEPVTELIPAMLQAFLESDRAFARSRRGASHDQTVT